MTVLPHLAARLFGVPLAIHRPKLDVILAVLGPRLGLQDLAIPNSFSPTARPVAASSPGVAVIPIHGTLVRRTVGLEAESGLSSYTTIAAQLEAALANPSVEAILLDVDSPGGESGGVFDLADRIRSASRIKPVWAVANDMAFSAAYALASAASRVFISRTGGVGSIGVIAMHVDQSVKDAKEGLHYTAVFAGERKNDLSPHEPMSSQAHAFLRAEVDRLYALFVQTVARHRGLEPAAVQDTEAALFFGQAAVDKGLADAVGSFDEALAALTASISPQPTAKAVTTQAESFCNHPKESLMNERTDTAAVDRPAVADAAGSVLEPAAAATLSMADAIEIAQTCQLAGRADLIPGFLAGNTAPAQVRQQLLSAQADTSPEISSRIAPDAALSAASNPLIDAVKRLAQPAGKEI
ncbi:S49 family peptidase [Vandammella animalimorsus]|uniref:Clp protease ClpP n=1 Tax=Vandammella animalimorsus TaxID=2029117 RepID=A0A2A2AW50_9BURK|nr:S49 family peptidase [Vandammella animalimorsus]PAT41987.1 Clp protease ClpP [Vandammella animalimorsus]